METSAVPPMCRKCGMPVGQSYLWTTDDKAYHHECYPRSDHAAELASLRASLAEAERERDELRAADRDHAGAWQSSDRRRSEAVARAEAAESKLAEAVKRATALEEGQRDLLAHLVAAVSLLKRTPKAKKAAPSNRMFDQMLADYEASIKRGRALAKHEGDGRSALAEQQE